ncbi:MAG: PrsW family glutamic-type intramembrane protease [Betaproteobacteria bacterium]
MTVNLALSVAVGLLPVLGFLAALVYLDSYKLVRLRVVIAIVAAGVAVAYVCYFVNGYLWGASRLDFTSFSRYVGPLVEELGKALVIVGLLRARRIGFLVDAAIAGFAVGTGFALVENIYYQQLVPDAGLGTWIVRGFGTAIMHGGTTAIFAVTSLSLKEHARRVPLAAFVPGFLMAVALHSAFNHLTSSPRAATLAVLVVLPPVMMFVFQRSERAVAGWLGHGFDADAQMLESITSGSFPDSPAGQYLASLRTRFEGGVVADLLCYLRLHAELALRAKGILMMRESGFDAALDEATREKFVEMRYLERSVGKTGRLAVVPLLYASDKDVWQFKMLEGEALRSAA